MNRKVQCRMTVLQGFYKYPLHINSLRTFILSDMAMGKLHSFLMLSNMTVLSDSHY